MIKGLPMGMLCFELNGNHYKCVGVNGSNNQCVDIIKDLKTGKLHEYDRNELYEKTRNAKWYSDKQVEPAKKNKKSR
jgi:hypothetical protein